MLKGILTVLSKPLFKKGQVLLDLEIEEGVWWFVFFFVLKDEFLFFCEIIWQFIIKQPLHLKLSRKSYRHWYGINVVFQKGI